MNKDILERRAKRLAEKQGPRTLGIWKHLDMWRHRFRTVCDACTWVKAGMNINKCYLPAEQAGREMIWERKEDIVN